MPLPAHHPFTLTLDVEHGYIEVTDRTSGLTVTADEALALARDLAEQAAVLKRRHAVYVLKQRTAAGKTEDGRDEQDRRDEESGGK